MYILDPDLKRIVYYRPPISEPSQSTPMNFLCEGVTPQRKKIKQPLGDL